MFVFPDKIRNICETSFETYKKFLYDNITKTYKRGSEGNISEFESELEHIAGNLSIGNRIERIKSREAFISFKDRNADLLIQQKATEEKLAN